MSLLTSLTSSVSGFMGRWRGDDVARLETQLASVETRLRMARARASGVKMSFGRFDIEFNDELKGTKKFDTLARMETDPHVKGSLRLQALPLMRADWSFRPATKSARDVEIAHFCDAVLLRKSNEHYGREVWTQTPWKAQRLPEILTMLTYGYSMFAKSPWRMVGDKQVRDYHWLEPASVDPAGWELNDADELVEVKRTYQTPQGRFVFRDPIPAQDIALYVWDMKGARFEGTPFIRCQYGPWMRKDLIQKFAVIFAQKVGAPVPMGSYPRGWQPSMIARFQEFIESLRGQSPVHAFGMFEQDAEGKSPEVRYVGAEVEQVDRMRGLINGENAEIAHGGGSKAQLAGETTTGTRSTTETQQETESGMVEATGEVIREWEMHGVANLMGPVEELCSRNYAGIDALPTLTFANIRPGEGMENLGKLFDGVKAQVIRVVPELRKQVVERLGFELPDDAYKDPAPAVAAPGAPGMGPDGKPMPPQGAKPGEPAEKPEDDATEQDMTGLALRQEIDALRKVPQGARVYPDGGGGAKPRGWFRAPSAFESQFVGLAGIERGLTLHEQLYYAAAAPVLRKAERDIVARVRSGRINARNFATLRLGKDGPNVKYRGELKRALLGVLRKTGKFGEEQVRGEIGKQQAALREDAA